MTHVQEFSAVAETGEVEKDKATEDGEGAQEGRWVEDEESLDGPTGPSS